MILADGTRGTSIEVTDEPGTRLQFIMPSKGSGDDSSQTCATNIVQNSIQIIRRTVHDV